MQAYNEGAPKQGTPKSPHDSLQGRGRPGESGARESFSKSTNNDYFLFLINKHT